MDRWYGYKAKSDDNWKKSDDYAMAFKVALRVSNDDPKAAELLVAWAERMADTLVLREWKRIHTLAFALLEHDSLTGAQVKQLIESHNSKDAGNDQRTTAKDKNI